MVSLGPIPLPAVLLALALVVAAIAGRFVARRWLLPGQATPVRVAGVLVDMLLVGLVAGRLAFIARWWSLYLAEPWSILRIGDGGFTPWVAVPAGLAFGAWRAWRNPALHRPLWTGATVGLLAWALMTGSLALLQQARIQLPGTELQALSGESVRLQDMAGQPMVVNLWATWCPPCRREMPVLADAQRARADITFVLANQGEGPELVQQYLDEAALGLHNVLLDPFSTVSRETGSRGLPTTLFFDGNGRLVDTHMGELTGAGLARKLERFEAGP